MGIALKYLREFLEKIGVEIDRKTASSLLFLLFILILLPVGLFLMKQQQKFFPRAEGELIQLGDGGCIRVNKDKKKAVDCPLVPLKLTNPFFDINTVNSVPPSVNLASPSVSPSLPPVKNIRETDPSKFENDLKTIGDLGGGVLYIPSGNYTLPKGFNIYSNTTLIGDGIGKTILNLPTGADSKVISTSGDGENKNIVIRDLSIVGPGTGGKKDDCCYGIRLRNVRDSFIVNIAVSGFSQDGIYLGQVNNKGVDNVRITGCKVSGNGRNGISLVHSRGSVIDNCEISNNSLRELVAGIDLEPDSGLNVSNNVIIGNNVHDNKNNGIQILQNPNDPGGIVDENAVCNNSFSNNKGTNFADYGTRTKTSGCLIPSNLANIPPAPTKPQANINGNILNFAINFIKPVIALTDEECSGDGCSQNDSDEGDDSPGEGSGCESDEQCSGYCDKHGSTNGKGVCRSSGKVSVNENSSSDSKEKGGAKRNKKTLEGKKCRKDNDCKDSMLACVEKKCTLIPGASVEKSSDSEVLTQNGESQDSSSNKIANESAILSGKLLYRLAESQAGLENASWKEIAQLPKKTDFASSLLKAVFNTLHINVFAKDSDDLFIDSKSFASPTATSSSTQNPSSPSSSSFGSASKSIGPQIINTSFQLASSQIGAKQIWVQFLHPDGTTRVDNVNFNLVEKPPQILGLSCNLDIPKENLKISIEGEHFGNSVGTVESVSPAGKPEVLSWTSKQITAFLKKPNIPINEGQRFKIKLTRTDGFESGTAICAIDKSLVSLGARIFCRAPGKFDASDVIVSLLYNPSDSADSNNLSKVDEKVTISADGEISNLKTKLQVGKNYGLSIKAPSSLRKSTIFTAQSGTTQILQMDGNPFILPIGDIAPPINPDGRINSLDRAELIRQWRILGKENTKPTADFNRDTRVNSIDWACMNYDFGSSDDPIPTSIPQSASDSIHIPGGEDTITISSSSSPIPSSFSSPEPSPSKDTSNSAKIDVGGKLFLDTNRNKVADIGESFISQGLATVKLLEVPEDHVIGTTLTQEELNDSRILIQSSNNLPGANYDISVFVDKDSGTKFSLQASASSGQLVGVVDFALGPPLIDTNLVINIPVSSPTQ